MPSIQKHGDKWRVQVAKKGVRKSAVWDDYKDAVRWGKRIESEIDATTTKGKTLQAAVDQYVRSVSARKSSPEWEKRRFASMLLHFGPDTKLDAIDSEAIGKWRDARLEHVSGSTVQREANLLRNLFAVACDEWRWIARNPFKGVKLPKHNPARRSVWTWALVRRVLRATRSGKTAEMQRAFRVSLHTGMRLQEVLTGKFDPRRRVYVLTKTKTSQQPVSIPVTRRAARALSTEPFTVGPNEGSVLFSKLCRELMIEGLTFHDARASALTWLSRRVDVLTLSRISQHKNLSLLSNVYYRETPEQIAARI